MDKSKLGLIHIYTGDGKGKTTAALGLIYFAGQRQRSEGCTGAVSERQGNGRAAYSFLAAGSNCVPRQTADQVFVSDE